MRLVLRMICVCALFVCASCGETIEPKLSVIQEKVFTPSCAFSSCHDAISPENGLDLTSGQAFTALLEGTSPDTQVARVVPGDAENSLLYQSVVGKAPGDIRAMPLGGSLSAEEIEAIKEWINLGASNN